MLYRHPADQYNIWYVPPQLRNSYLDCMRKKDTQYKDSTIKTHITSRLCANAPNHHGATYNDLERTDRGTYRLLR